MRKSFESTQLSRHIKRKSTVVTLVLVVATAIGAVVAAANLGNGPATLYTFGDDGNGQLGYDPNIDPPPGPSINPTPTLVTVATSGGPLTAAAGSFHSAVVTATGELFTFGQNGFGQLGRATIGAVDFLPTLVVLPGATGGVVQVAAGQQYTLALTDTGQVFAFGLNDVGQLGTATNAATLNPNQTPMLVTMPPTMTGTVVRIAIGYKTSFAATSTGELYAWGQNDTWQLGYSNNSVFDTANSTPTLISLPGQSGTISEIAGSVGHTLVLTSTGQVFGFGGNGAGELANLTAGTGPGFMTLPAPLTISGLTGGVTHIGVGWEHSMVSSGSGQLFAFGENYWGELGNTTNMFTYNANPTPVLVSLAGQSGSIAQLAGGLRYSAVVTSVGQVFTFGTNQQGQLGRPLTSTTCGFVSNCDPTPALATFPAGTQIASIGVGVASDFTLAVPAIAATAPDAPTGVSAVAGDASAIVSWTPGSDGGSAITGFTVTSSPGGFTAAAAAGATSTTVSGLTNGTAYTFVVTATNAIGISPASSPSNSVTPGTVPAAPSNVTAVAGNASATVSWSVPASDGGSAITGYTATSSPGGVTANAAANATSVPVSGLTNGTAYTFTVTASNANGPSVPSAPSNSVTPSGPATATTKFPASTTILSGTLLSGSAANLAADDGSYFQVSSTTKGTRATAWYGSFTNVPSSLSSLQVTYSGSNSVACMQTIAIYKWTTKKWVALDSRSVGPTKMVIANLTPSGSLSNYVSGTGEVRVQAGCSASKSTFVSSGDLMEIIFIPGNPVK